MVVAGPPGAYGGTIAVGSLQASVAGVEAEEGRLTVRAEGSMGLLVLRFAVDGDHLSGEWRAGSMLGGVTATKAGGNAGTGLEAEGDASATTASSRSAGGASLRPGRLQLRSAGRTPDPASPRNGRIPA